MPDLTAQTVEIPLSKRKIAWTLAGAALFVAVGAALAARPDVFADNPFLRNPAWLRAFGMLVAALFGALGFVVAKKLGDPAPGLVVGPEGFVDNASGLVAGFVPWADVSGLQKLTLMGQKMLLVTLSDPNKYIARQTNPFKRQLLQTNFQSYGSPVLLSANALQCSYPELCQVMLSRFQAYRTAAIG